MSFAHQSQPPGVADHGLLSGLLGHDHTQYGRLAEAELLSGAWWVSETTSLRFGHAAGPTLAGPAAGDDLTLTGDLVVTGGLRVMDSPVNPGRWLTVSPADQSGSVMVGVDINPNLPTLPVNNATLYGVYGAPTANLTPGITGARVIGLNYSAGAGVGGSGTVLTALYGLQTQQTLGVFTGTVTKLAAYLALSPLILGGTPSVTTSVGLELPNMGISNKIVDAYGIRLADFTANTGVRRLLDLGPATPYLRLLGGPAPAAGQTNLYLSLGGTLRQVQSKDGASIGAGDNVAVFV